MFKKEVPVFVPIERTRTEYVDRNITINRAPTDESVKLLREMEAKTKENVIQATVVGDTQFECVVHAEMDHLSDARIWRAVFKLNGKQMAVEVTTHSRVADLHDVWTALRDKMAVVIAAQVLQFAFAAAVRPIR